MTHIYNLLIFIRVIYNTSCVRRDVGQFLLVHIITIVIIYTRIMDTYVRVPLHINTVVILYVMRALTYGLFLYARDNL